MARHPPTPPWGRRAERQRRDAASGGAAKWGAKRGLSVPSWGLRIARHIGVKGLSLLSTLDLEGLRISGDPPTPRDHTVTQSKKGSRLSEAGG